MCKGSSDVSPIASKIRTNMAVASWVPWSKETDRDRVHAATIISESNTTASSGGIRQAELIRIPRRNLTLVAISTKVLNSEEQALDDLPGQDQGHWQNSRH